jgi:hypothetical protein
MSKHGVSKPKRTTINDLRERVFTIETRMGIIGKK